MCGEQLFDALGFQPQFGSPPRVRGTGACRAAAWERGGITPACAGNSPCGGAEGDEAQDHPRVCGEQRLNIWLFLI